MELFELDINALSKGKKEAFFILYKKFFVALCLFAQKFSIGKEAAEDIVQEIFYKLYEERQIFHYKSLIKASEASIVPKV